MTYESSRKCSYYPHCTIHRGTRNPGDKLGPREISEILSLKSRGFSLNQISYRTGISVTPIQKVIHGRHFTQKDNNENKQDDEA